MINDQPKSDYVSERYRSPRQNGRKPRSGGSCTPSKPGSRTPGTPSRRALGLRFATAHVKSCFCSNCRVPTDIYLDLIRIKQNAQFSLRAINFIFENPALFFTHIWNTYADMMAEVYVFWWGKFFWVFMLAPLVLILMFTLTSANYLCTNVDPEVTVELGRTCFYIDLIGNGPMMLVEMAWSSYFSCVRLIINLSFICTPIWLGVKRIISKPDIFTILGTLTMWAILHPTLYIGIAWAELLLIYLSHPLSIVLLGLGPHLYLLQLLNYISTRLSNNTFWLKFTLRQHEDGLRLTPTEEQIWIKYAIFMGHMEILDDHTVRIGVDIKRTVSLLPAQSMIDIATANMLSTKTYSQEFMKRTMRYVHHHMSGSSDNYIRDLVYDISKATCFILNSRGNILVVITALLNYTDNRYNTRIVFDQDMRESFRQSLIKLTQSPQLERDGDMEPQSLDALESIADFGQILVENYNGFVESLIYKKIYKLFCYTLAFGIFADFGVNFDSCGYNKLQAELISQKYYKRTSFAVSLIDTCSFLAKQGIQYCKTGIYSHIFHSGATYQKWFDDCRVLQNQSKFLDDPEAAGFSVFEYEGNLDSAIEVGQSIVKYGSQYANKYEAAALKECYGKLELLRANLATTKRANQTRKPPLGIMLHGDSGIGKSYLKDMIFYYYCGLRDLPNGDEYKYTRSPASEFWDGFRSSVHTLVMDDVAYLKPGATNSVDLSLNEIIQVMNPTPMMPNQASLEKKGRTPFLGELLIATTNIKDLNAYDYFAHPSAVQRRLPYIVTPTVRREYQKKGGALNTQYLAKLNGAGSDCIEDYWTFQIEEVHATPFRKAGANMAEYKIIHENLSTYEFLAWFGEIVGQHHDQQNVMKASVDKLKTMDVCKLCYNLRSRCECEQQSLRVAKEFLTAKTSLPFMFVILSRIINFYNILDGMLWWMCLIFALYPLNKKDVAYGVIYYAKWRIMGKIDRTREAFYQIGKNVNENYGYPAKLLIMLASAMTISAIYGMWSYKMPQQAERVPKPKDEQKNPWKKNDYQTTDFDVPRVSISWKHMTRSELIKKLQHNICRINIYDNGGSTRAMAFGLCGHWYIANKHSFPSAGDMEIEIIKGSQMDGVNPSIKVVRRQTDIIRFDETDCALMYIRELPPVRDVRGLLASSTLNCTDKGFYLLRDYSGNLCQKEINSITKTGYVSWNQTLGVFWKGRADIEQTTKGDCGAPLIAETILGPVILGIHCAGDGPATQAFHIPEKILDVVNRCDTSIDSGEPNISAPGFNRHVNDLHFKSPIRYIEEGSAVVYGSFQGFRAQPKSRVEETPMSEFLGTLGYSIKYTKPDVSSWRPKRIALQDLVDPIYKVDQTILEEVKMHFLNDIIAALPKDELELLTPYDTYTAINGAKGISHVDRINVSSSAGNPYKKVKKHFLAADPTEDLPEGVKFLEPINDRIKEMEQTYKDKRRVQPNFCAHLKDEPVTFAKAESGKTRVFTGAPIDWTIVVRKYLLSFVRVAMRNRFAFECSVGLVVQSKQWGELYHHLTKFGTETVVAGDYKAFDKKMSPLFTMAAFDIIKELCQLSGNYSEEELDIISGIATDTCYPLVDYFGDLIQFFGSNPSGQPITVNLNSLVNSLYVRYVYHILNPEREVRSFKENVAITTYGDDILMTVNPKIPWFNHTTIANILAQMGITFTMADKDAESVPYINMHQATFLKRTFRFDHDVGDWLAPLDHDSIEKSLMVWVRSKTVSKEKQCVDIISSAAREYFFYGRAVYLKRCEMFMRLISHLGLESYMSDSTLPRYENLLEDFHSFGISGAVLTETEPPIGDSGYLGSMCDELKALSPIYEYSTSPSTEGKVGLGSQP